MSSHRGVCSCPAGVERGGGWWSREGSNNVGRGDLGREANLVAGVGRASENGGLSICVAWCGHGVILVGHVWGPKAPGWHRISETYCATIE